MTEDEDVHVGRVTYPLRDGWQVTVEQNFAMPTTGPTRLVIEPDQADVPRELPNGDVDFGAFDSDGIQQALLRMVPLRQARKDLEDQRLARLGGSIADRIPRDFAAAGDLGLARVAAVYVQLWGHGVRNPVAVIAKACEPHTPGTWAARVRRARAKGFLLGTERDAGDAEPSLGPRAVALLGGMF